LTETRLYQTIIRNLLARRGGFFVRIDHEMLPDIYTAKNRMITWIELKCINYKQKIIHPKWRPGQLAWIKLHQLKGGDNIILCLWYVDKYYFLHPREYYMGEEELRKYEVKF
jgi:hypothetical protein